MSPAARKVAVLVAVLVVLSAAGMGVRLWREGEDALLGALRLAPGDAARYSWTDWAGVRAELGATGLDAGSPRGEVAGFLDRAFDEDLSTASVLDDAGGLLHDGFGFSPATLDWELLAQGTQGQVVLGGLPEDLEATVVEDHLRDLGFVEPAGDQDVWSGTEADLAGIDPDSETMPLLTQVGVDADLGVVVTGDDPGYVQQALDGLDDAALPDGVTAAAAALGEPLSAFVTTGDYACAEMSFVGADPTDQAQAAERVAQAGPITPMRGFAMAVEPAGSPREVRVAMDFESEDQARRNADARARLAVGPAPGQGGTFEERFTLGEVAARGSVVTMELRPVEGQRPFGDLSTGTLLFAGC